MGGFNPSGMHITWALPESNCQPVTRISHPRFCARGFRSTCCVGRIDCAERIYFFLLLCRRHPSFGRASDHSLPSHSFSANCDQMVMATVWLKNRKSRYVTFPHLRFIARPFRFCFFYKGGGNTLRFPRFFDSYFPLIFKFRGKAPSPSLFFRLFQRLFSDFLSKFVQKILPPGFSLQTFCYTENFSIQKNFDNLEKKLPGIVFSPSSERKTIVFFRTPARIHFLKPSESIANYFDSKIDKDLDFSDVFDENLMKNMLVILFEENIFNCLCDIFHSICMFRTSLKSSYYNFLFIIQVFSSRFFSVLPPKKDAAD